MDLGEKLLRARLEAGLSQRQLCADVITRNMLSQIEHGTARPSMDTLRYLAQRLGKNISYFLDEDTVTSPNQQVMADARSAYDSGNFAAALKRLEDYRTPDDTFDREKALLQTLSLLSLAEKAVAEQRFPYARSLLEQIRPDTAYRIPELERRRALLLGRLPETDKIAVCRALPSLDEELLLRAEGALAQDDPKRAIEFLAAAEDKAASRWNLLQGKALFVQKNYTAAVDFLKAAETAYPRECWPMIEVCCREMKDFEQAYRYACKQKEK